MIKKQYRAKIKPFSPVLVRWKDPSTQNGWRPESFAREVADVMGVDCESVGMLMRKDERGVVLVQSVASKLPEDDVAEVLEIPRGSVKEIYLFE